MTRVTESPDHETAEAFAIFSFATIHYTSQIESIDEKRGLIWSSPRTSHFAQVFTAAKRRTLWSGITSPTYTYGDMRVCQSPA